MLISSHLCTALEEGEGKAHFESLWGRSYQEHPLSHLVGFVPTTWLVSIASRKPDLGSNNLKGEMLSGARLNETLKREGMVHPIIISINGVGEDFRVRLDCGQHRARVACLIAGIGWLPCFVEVSHGRSPFIRGNGPHEYALNPEALAAKPDIKAQFMSPASLFSRYEVSDIDGGIEYIRNLEDLRR